MNLFVGLMKSRIKASLLTFGTIEDSATRETI